jgi:acetyltransferase-like isoleucine patch superfamily enzyme
MMSSKLKKIARLLFRETGNWIGFMSFQLADRIMARENGLGRARLLRLLGFKIGRHCWVGQGVFIGSQREPIHIGNRCRIGHGAFFDGTSPIHVEDDCVLEDGVKLITANHILETDFTQRRPPYPAGPIYLHQGVHLEPGVFVLPNVTVGEGATVLKDSLVTKSVAPHDVVSGSPAKPRPLVTEGVC